jgi:prepilin-type N-terminal cleavage/methylation domain-containing protein/prepilin-type processing-associated H-X9-DG protein
MREILFERKYFPVPDLRTAPQNSPHFSGPFCFLDHTYIYESADLHRMAALGFLLFDNLEATMKVEIVGSKHRFDTEGLPRDRWSGVTSMSGKQILKREKPHCTSTQIADRESSVGNPSGFTLIELLVVISILVLLMAILLPALHGARNRARAVACQAKLRQWGIVFQMYMEDHDDRFYHGEGGDRWWWCARPYYGHVDALFLCPMATRWEINKNDPKWEGLGSLGDSSGSKFTAWKLNREFRNVGREKPLVGSYGWSIYVAMTYSEYPAINGPPPPRGRMPFLLDCVLPYAAADGPPPAYDGDLSSYGMKSVCIDRHNGGINNLFMDWSVRKVGLKELWTLKWCSGYNTSGPWTRAGGAHRRTGRRG